MGKGIRGQARQLSFAAFQACIGRPAKMTFRSVGQSVTISGNPLNTSRMGITLLLARLQSIHSCVNHTPAVPIQVMTAAFPGLLPLGPMSHGQRAEKCELVAEYAEVESGRRNSARRFRPPSATQKATDQEAGVQSPLAIRKPTSLKRSSGRNVVRKAERRPSGGRYQEPPRRTR